MKKKQKKKLKPVVYTTNYFKTGAPQETQQIVLLKAMQVTQDPKKLKEMIGVRTVAEVYRTLDKLSIRKEYHDALARNGISLDFVVDGIKNIAMSGEKDGDRLKAFQTLLKSVGLDKYEASDDTGGGTWEEELLKAVERSKEQGELPGEVEEDFEEYEVEHPEMPESMKKLREAEKDLTDSFYDKQD